jgi:F-type H+-transporting ATPase subunit a
VYWQRGFFHLNATIFFTWVVMALLTIATWLITRHLSTGEKISRWQNLLEVLVSAMRKQIRDISSQKPGPYLEFVGTLFLFVAVSNLLAVVPGFQPPTGSLSTTAALSLCVFLAVPFYGVAQSGFRNYLANYLKPTVFMLPFNIIGELSRTLALAVRLFGNIMSGTMIAGILLAIAPLFFPVLMHAFGLLIGLIQAYIFAILAMVYIASATEAHHARQIESARQQNQASVNHPLPGD